jgi:hypothetical protein
MAHKFLAISGGAGLEHPSESVLRSVTVPTGERAVSVVNLRLRGISHRPNFQRRVDGYAQQGGTPYYGQSRYNKMNDQSSDHNPE